MGMRCSGAEHGARQQGIELALTQLETVPKDKIQATIDSLVQRIHALEKSVTDNISRLVPYEVRVCLEASFRPAVKAMSENLSDLRGQLIPKPKFTFKSRKAVASGASSPSTSMSSSSTTTPIVSKASTPVPGDGTKLPPAEAADQANRFMKFENRVNEHLFIGALKGETDSSAAMEQDVYLGGVPVDMGSMAASRLQEEPKDVALTNLVDCTINLVHPAIPLGAIHIKNLKRCILVIPPVSGSILLHDCEGCTLIGACHQSRMHTSTNMDIYLHVTSEPIIEDCTDMRFASYPYNDILPAEQLTQLFNTAKLNPAVNYHDRVKDFNWLRQQRSPNWRLLEPHEIRHEVAQLVLAKDADASKLHGTIQVDEAME
ncbi:tubulin binding cofactor C-domain-containing protein [Mortierella sp. GBAus27b]|nr:tubulin binding cofactor C-domain-containing protein [Mortierella sp. GBAus27b]